MNQEIPKELKDLIIARLEESSGNRLTFFGNVGNNLTKDDLIEEVEKGSEIGKKIIEVELGYLKAMIDGDLLREASKA